MQVKIKIKNLQSKYYTWLIFLVDGCKWIPGTSMKFGTYGRELKIVKSESIKLSDMFLNISVIAGLFSYPGYFKYVFINFSILEK